MKSLRLALLFVSIFSFLILSSCQTASIKQNASGDPLIDGYLSVATASVSDAVDQIIGKRGYMSHQIRPLSPTKMCGRAVTVLAKPSTEKQPPSMALELIDEEPPGKVLVIVMDGPDGADVAAFGGIMCTGSVQRQFAGAVLDGGCRDVLEIEAMGFPVFTKGIAPTNSVGRYINVGKNIPVKCGGVMVAPGDIIIGDSDGVVVVPQKHAAEVLARAQELEAKEAVTTKAVKKLKSIRKAAEKNNRI
ncbi:MAG: RraA family protein [Candidatus Hinthialibacter antarcticus]|nr:RraA family protein [Candidatus Hinthialibacter antarcticus]